LNLKRHRLHLILLIPFAYFFEAGCVKPPAPDAPPDTQKFISSFSFTTSDNPSLSATVSAGGIADTILCWFPSGANLSNLIPTIEFTGKSISPGNKIAGNFANLVNYEVTAEDGSVKKYTVSCKFIPASGKEIVEFNFRMVDNPGLSADAIGVIKTDSVLVTVPYGTNLTSLKPYITFTGNNITPSSLQARDFVSPVSYIVTAENGTSKVYAVKVQILQPYLNILQGTIYIGTADGGPNHINRFFAIDINTGLSKWKYTRPGLPGYFLHSGEFNNGIVYATSDSTLLAIDTVTQSVVWSFQAPKYFSATPTIANGVLYINCEDMNLYALDISTGALKWKFSQDPIPTGLGGNWSSPTVSNGVVYFGSLDHHIYSVDAITGILKWKIVDNFHYATGHEIQCSPAVVNGVLYIGEESSDLIAINTIDGSIKWRYFIGSVIFSSPTVVDGVVYVGASDARLYAIDAISGTLKWSYQSAKQIYNSPAVSNGVVYFGGWGANSNGFYAVNAATGTLKWVFSYSLGFHSSPIIYQGYVFVGSDDALLALDANTGTLKWKFNGEAPSDDFAASPIIVDKNGKVYYSSISGSQN
jgi:outer membrane protein assembly factor BamB